MWQASEQRVNALEMYTKNCSFRTVGETKYQIPNKCKSDLLEDYTGNTPSHSRCICQKTCNEWINELTCNWFQDPIRSLIQVSGPLIQRQVLKFSAD